MRYEVRYGMMIKSEHILSSVCNSKKKKQKQLSAKIKFVSDFPTKCFRFDQNF